MFLLFFAHGAESQSDLVSAVVQSVKVDNIELLGLVVFCHQVTMTKNDVIVKFFADDPNGKYRVFQMFSYLNVAKGFKNCKETKFRTVYHPSNLVIIYYLLSVKTI